MLILSVPRVIALCIVMAWAAVVFQGCGSGADTSADNSAAANAPTVAVVKATRKNLSSTLEIASEFQPFQEVSVYAKVSGYIHKLYVDWGTHVREGDLLAVLEIPELQQQLELDQAAVRRSEHDLARAQEDLAQANSKYQVADLTYNRLSTVMKTRPGLVAQEEVDIAQGKDVEAKAGVSGAQAEVAGAEQALAGAKAGLEKDRAMFSYSRITAPFDGVVTQIGAYTGALLPAGTSSTKADQALCRISQNSVLRLVIPVPESALPEIRLGSRAQVHVPVLSKTFLGTVARIADQVDLSTRTMHTEIDVPNPKLEIIPGMYAEASLILKEQHDVLTVPVQAVDRREGHATVFVVREGNNIEEQPVQTGMETSDAVQVLSGLRENDLVLVGNRSQLHSGLRVVPKLASSALTVE